MAISAGGGLLCAVLSAVFNGSFTVPFKVAASSSGSSLREVEADGSHDVPVSSGDADDHEQTRQKELQHQQQVHPIVFTLYVSLGVFLSSMIFIVPFVSKISINVLSMTAGFLFVLGVSASFLAVDLIGIALAQGVWAGSATVVSYVWGTIIFGDHPQHPWWSVFGLSLLIAGVIGIAYCDVIAHRQQQTQSLDGCIGRVIHVVRALRHLLFRSCFGESSSSGRRERLGSKEELEPLSGDVNGQSDREDLTATEVKSSASASATNYATGVFWACSVGLFGGSILAPTHYLEPEEQGLAVMPSFGIGCLLLAPIVLLIHSYWTGSMPPFNVKVALMPGLFSGFLWNVSNFLSLMAIPAIGYGVAYPLLQGAVLISGLWGIAIFKEITNRRTVAVFWFAGAILLTGAAILAAAQ